jgi:hypothetical protein
MKTWPPAIAKNAKLATIARRIPGYGFASAAFAIPVGLYSATL